MATPPSLIAWNRTGRVPALVLGALWLSLATHVVFVVARPSWWIVPALLVGWFLADAASGIVHMVMDYQPCPPELGLDRLYFYQGSRESDHYQSLIRTVMRDVNPFQRVVFDFKTHHPRPDALGRRTLWRQIGSTVMVATLPLSLALNVLALMTPLPGWAMAGAVALLLGGSFAQFFHGSLHRAHNPWPITAMRRVGLLMTPQAHQKHHDTLKRDFSTNCGWSNPFLNPVFAFGYRRGWFRDEGLEPARASPEVSAR